MCQCIYWVFTKNYIFLGNLKIIVVDTQERTTLLLKECINKTISLDLLIHMNKLNASIKELIKKSGVIVKWFSEIEGRGSKCILPFVVSNNIIRISFFCVIYT